MNWINSFSFLSYPIPNRSAKWSQGDWLSFSSFLAYYVAWVHKVPCENRETDSKRRMKVKGPSQAITCNQKHQNTSSYLMPPKLHLLLWYLLLSSVREGFHLHWIPLHCWIPKFLLLACLFLELWALIMNILVIPPPVCHIITATCSKQICYLPPSSLFSSNFHTPINATVTHQSTQSEVLGLPWLFYSCSVFI